MKTALLILLPLLNVIQLYFIVTTNSGSVVVTDLLRSLHEQFGETFDFSRTPDTGHGKGQLEPEESAIPRPTADEVEHKKTKVKWSRSPDQLQYLAKHEQALYKLMNEFKVETQLNWNRISRQIISLRCCLGFTIYCNYETYFVGLQLD
jgi:hypothetical protein